MAEKIVVESEKLKEKSSLHCEELEKGNILFFPKIPFPFAQEDIDFLLKQRQTGSSSRKNIAYKPQLNKISNHDTQDLNAAKRLKEILENYSNQATHFLSEILSPYKDEWRLDYASFRPFQEKGRNLRVRARNDLLHVDAFATRPLNGDRILRFFTNINPDEDRIWNTSKDFAQLVEEFQEQLPLPLSLAEDQKARFVLKAKKILKSLGVKTPLRSPYDEFMLKMHHFLKENETFQNTCKKDRWEFPPLSCWAVFTDQVSHAALAGQYALEQTIIIPQKALLHPEKSPLGVLERMKGKSLVIQGL